MSLSTLLYRINSALKGFERTFLGALIGRHPPDDFRLCLDVLLEENVQIQPSAANKGILEQILGDGLLFAVPKHRRSLEKRLKRKYGSPEYKLKILLPRKDLKTCNVCSDDHEAGVFCPTCYKRVINETKAMQEAIQDELKLEPVEQEVIVMYEGEKESKPEEFWEGKRIVEMKKSRPQWFSDNLLQRSTQNGADTSDVKPSELG